MSGTENQDIIFLEEKLECIFIIKSGQVFPFADLGQKKLFVSDVVK